MLDSALPTTPSQRAVFTGAGALLVGAAVTATASLPDASPDAELIRICEQHPRNVEAFNSCGEDGGPDNPTWLEYTRTQDAISEAKPVTLAGMLAKARAAKAEALQPDGSEHSSNCVAEDWAWDLVNDLLRLAHPAINGGRIFR